MGLTTVLTGRTFLESPRWHRGALFAVDVYPGEVLEIRPDGLADVLAALPSGVMSIGWDAGGRLLVAGYTDRRLFKLENGRLEAFADLSGLAAHCLHDMAQDSLGRTFIGHMDYDYAVGQDFVPDSLIRVDPDGSAQVVARDMRSANGMAVTPDDSMLLVAESRAHRINSFEIRPDGTLSDKSIWAKLDTTPDGLCLDAEGAVWVALPMENRFVRVLRGGAVTDSIDTPQHAIGCTLGGEDGRTLFLVTDSTLGIPQEAAAARSSTITSTRVAVPGVGRP
jgi:sugar lactone lactonase YvrE